MQLNNLHALYNVQCIAVIAPIPTCIYNRQTNLFSEGSQDNVISFLGWLDQIFE